MIESMPGIEVFCSFHLASTVSLTHGTDLAETLTQTDFWVISEPFAMTGVSPSTTYDLSRQKFRAHITSSILSTPSSSLFCYWCENHHMNIKNKNPWCWKAG